MNNKICGECRHHYPDDGRPRPSWYCGNDESEYYGDYTEYADTCERFEERGID